MDYPNLNSNHGFKYALTSLLLLLLAWFFFLVLFVNGYQTAGKYVSFLLIVPPILGIIGLVYSFKGIREPNTARKILALILNIAIPGIFIFSLVMNALDIYRVLN